MRYLIRNTIIRVNGFVRKTGSHDYTVSESKELERQSSWKEKNWKEKAAVFTYDPREFSTDLHSLPEIINDMCHAEFVHEVGIVLSFTSLLLAIPFGAFFVFLITAILGALFDLQFVIMQRYNRPRVVILMEKRNR